MNHMQTFNFLRFSGETEKVEKEKPVAEPIKDEAKDAPAAPQDGAAAEDPDLDDETPEEETESLPEDDDFEMEEDLEDGDAQDVAEGDDDSAEFDFDIGDHLDRLLSLLDLGGEDGINDGIGGLLEKMLSPHIMSALPFSDVALDDEDLDGADDLRGKIVMMHGHGQAGEPMEMQKKVIDLGKDQIAASRQKVELRLAGVKRLLSKEPSNIRVAAIGAESVVDDRIEYMGLLQDAFDLALRYADARGQVSDDSVADLIVALEPGEYRRSLPTSTRQLVSGVISDLAMYNETEGFFRSAAERIKAAYRAMVDGGMSRSAYYEVRKAPAEETEDYNPCPKFRSSGVEVPVEMSFCRDYCIEGKQQPDGKVECKFSKWLEKVADSHQKAMSRLDEQKNPVNDHMQLRLPDGQKEHPRRAVDTHIEVKFEREGKHGREWDDLKSSAKSAGRHMNYEALISEMLDESHLGRGTADPRVPTEERLNASRKDDEDQKQAEVMLDKADKWDDKIHEDGRSNTEANVEGVRPKKGFDTDKLLDELIEDAYPRDHDKRSKE